ncbi:MAG TPA: TIGR02757 family protein [Saprospiraceae bacterium]|nr:TIGR02757 family protein [Saprospiraceae bacterium]
MNIQDLLETAYRTYHIKGFIENDPISIPHEFSRKQDIEIMGFWTAVLSWGRRASIIKSAHRLTELMDGAPYDFIKHHQEKDLIPFTKFVHRTFQPTDALYFIHFLHDYYQTHDTLEDAFAQAINPTDPNVKNGLIAFHELFFSLPDAPDRTRKHIPTPLRKSSCKRLNMFLRWMVRDGQVDFGIWKQIKTDQLLIPLDVHVERMGKKLGLLHRKQRDWKAVEELTQNLKKFDPDDPVKYDFALFGLGLDDFSV